MKTSTWLVAACLAASFTDQGQWLSEEAVDQVLKGFQVRAFNGTQSVSALALQRLSVDSVSFSNGSIYMLLENGSTRAYNDVLAFM